MNEAENTGVLEATLSLLDDPAASVERRDLDLFAKLEALVETSILPEKNELQELAAPSAHAEKVPELMISAVEGPLGTEPRAYSQTNLSQRISVQKVQNETLIRALQDLRKRMSESKGKSGKILPKA